MRRLICFSIILLSLVAFNSCSMTQYTQHSEKSVEKAKEQLCDSPMVEIVFLSDEQRIVEVDRKRYQVEGSGWFSLGRTSVWVEEGNHEIIARGDTLNANCFRCHRMTVNLER